MCNTVSARLYIRSPPGVFTVKDPLGKSLESVLFNIDIIIILGGHPWILIKNTPLTTVNSNLTKDKTYFTCAEVDQLANRRSMFLHWCKPRGLFLLLKMESRQLTLAWLLVRR